jgi:geranylgeranyl diphosphate synthase, type II
MWNRRAACRLGVLEPDMDLSEFKTRCGRVAQAVETAIEGYLSHDPVPEALRKAMLYSLRAGGKRSRPLTLVFACEACGGQEILALPAAAAIEMVHTYSLIHDDLPAMDNDDLRRGQPTSHKVFGEGLAILAGDALLTYAFHTLARHVREDNLARQLVLELSHAAGGAGMIGGQVADLQNQNVPGDLNTVAYIHSHKTAMLFRAAARMGALCAGADSRRIGQLADYGLKLGLGFQIMDDLLDVTGTQEETGKRTQKDGQAGKLTYPAILGVEASRRQADTSISEAIATLDELGPAAEPLRLLARSLSHRKN